MKNKWMIKKLGVFFALTMVVSLSGCSQEEGAAPVATLETAEEDGEINVFGKIEATDKEEVYINFPASVKDVLVEEGQTVKKGETLLILDYENYKNEIKVEEKQKALNALSVEDGNQEISALQVAVSTLEEEKRLKEGYLDDSGYQLESLKKSLEVIETQIKDLKEDYEAEQELLEVGASTSKAVQNIAVKIDGMEDEKIQLEKQIKNFKESTQLEVEQLSAQIASKQDEITQKQGGNSRVENKQSLNNQISELTIANMNQKLDQTYLEGDKVISDLDEAIVDEIVCEKGSYLGDNGASYCLSLLDSKSIQVVADVPEEFISEIKMGQSCQIKPYYDNTKTLTGKVVRIEERAIEQDGEIVVKVYIDLVNHKEPLKPGFSVDVFF